jgi:hypothetical protein
MSNEFKRGLASQGVAALGLMPTLIVARALITLRIISRVTGYYGEALIIYETLRLLINNNATAIMTITTMVSIIALV